MSANARSAKGKNKEQTVLISMVVQHLKGTSFGCLPPESFIHEVLVDFFYKLISVNTVYCTSLFYCFAS